MGLTAHLSRREFYADVSLNAPAWVKSIRARLAITQNRNRRFVLAGMEFTLWSRDTACVGADLSAMQTTPCKSITGCPLDDQALNAVPARYAPLGATAQGRLSHPVHCTIQVNAPTRPETTIKSGDGLAHDVS
jgi:hypothetical protein